jgi:hypothetical protein
MVCSRQGMPATRMLPSKKPCACLNDDMCLRRQERTEEMKQKTDTLLVPTSVAKANTTVVADLRVIATWRRVVVTTAARREVFVIFVIFLKRSDLGGQIRSIINVVVVEVFSVMATMFVCARVILPVGMLRIMLLRVAVNVTDLVGRICSSTSGTRDEFLNIGVDTSIE